MSSIWIRLLLASVCALQTFGGVGCKAPPTIVDRQRQALVLLAPAQRSRIERSLGVLAKATEAASMRGDHALVNRIVAERARLIETASKTDGSSSATGNQ